MHQKAADELDTIQGQLLPLAAASVILHLYGHGVFAHAEDAAVADCYPVRVTSEVMHHGLRSGKRLPDIRDPFLSITGIQQFLVFILVAVPGRLPLIAQVSRLMQRFQPGQELALKKCGHCFSGQEEAALLLVPVPVSVKSAACTEYMDMGMVGQVRAPRVHDADEAGGASHMRRIPGKLHDSLCHGMEEQGIQFLLVAVDQGVQLAWAGKYQMIVIDIQHMLVLRIDPQFIGQRLAHGAGSVTAGIVMYLDMAALAASGDVHPVCPCLAVEDVDCRLCLSGIGGIFLQVSGVELPQDILDSRFTFHRRRSPSQLFQTCRTGS